MPRLLLFLVLIGVTVYAAVDCIQTPDEEVRNLPKIAWVLIILLFGLPPIGAAVWYFAGRPRTAGLAGGGSPLGPGRPWGVGPAGRPGAPGRGRSQRWPGTRPAPGSGAPDDDPEFLAGLDRWAREEEARRRREEHPPQPPGHGPDGRPGTDGAPGDDGGSPPR